MIDLEGVAGVDAVDDLIAGSPGYPTAQRRLTEEVEVAARALLAAGFDAVRVSDSHISGSGETNLLLSELSVPIELCLDDDPYAEAMFDGVSAVAALGMHAAADTAGFAAHTVNLHSRWSQGGRPSSELDLLLGLTAERGLPFYFATGDEVLASSLPATIPFLVTKTRVGSAFCSLPKAEALERLSLLIRDATPVVPALPPETPIHIRFKSRWQADLAEGAEADRMGPLDFEIRGGSFSSRYQRAWRLTEQGAEGMEGVLAGEVGSPEFVAGARALLARGFESHVGVVDELELVRARDAFLSLTEGSSSESRALRALILHMCEHHAPRAFQRLGLASELETSLDALSLVPATLDAELESDELQARVDARYIEHARGRRGALIDREPLARTLDALDERGDELYAFILGSMANSMGVPVDERHLRSPAPDERVLALYVLTHEILFETAYLTRPFGKGALVALREQLLLAASEVIEAGHVDLAAELLVLIQAMGEQHSKEHVDLLSFLRSKTTETGQVLDASLGVPPEELADHATGLSLLALAGAYDRAQG